jgi:hypothetical protein
MLKVNMFLERSVVLFFRSFDDRVHDDGSRHVYPDAIVVPFESSIMFCAKKLYLAWYLIYVPCGTEEEAVVDTLEERLTVTD